MRAMIRTLTGALVAIVAVALFTGNALAVGDDPVAAPARDATGGSFARVDVDALCQFKFGSNRLKSNGLRETISDFSEFGFA